MEAQKKQNRSFWQLFNLSFGFFGVQIAYALQSANISRIFSMLGADPSDLSLFWIFPPLMGMIVQPIIGVMSDKTWCRLGRRIPYLFIGAILAVIVMCLLPNAASFGLSTAYGLLGLNSVLWFGIFVLIFLDVSINIAMQPFKMLVGDMVNEEQKVKAYSIQSFLCNAGSIVGFLFPWFFAWIGVQAPETTDAAAGIPLNVKLSFYVGAAILILCVIYTTFMVKEMPPKEYAEFHVLEENKKEEKVGIITLLKRAPANFWLVGLVQFFCWSAFLFMWSYSTGSLASNIFEAPTVLKEGTLVLDTDSPLYHQAGDWYGVLSAIMAVSAVLWATIIPRFKNKKVVYSLSLLLGAIGFISLYWVTPDLLPASWTQAINEQGVAVADIAKQTTILKWIAAVPFALIGCAWAAMLALPFSIVTNSLKGDHMGTYLGLFNCAICLPQIIAAAAGKLILPAFTTADKIAPEITMLVVAGILLICGSLSVFLIRDDKK